MKAIGSCLAATMLFAGVLLVVYYIAATKTHVNKVEPKAKMLSAPITKNSFVPSNEWKVEQSKKCVFLHYSILEDTGKRSLDYSSPAEATEWQVDVLQSSQGARDVCEKTASEIESESPDDARDLRDAAAKLEQERIHWYDKFLQYHRKHMTPDELRVRVVDAFKSTSPQEP